MTIYREGKESIRPGLQGDAVGVIFVDQDTPLFLSTSVTLNSHIPSLLIKGRHYDSRTLFEDQEVRSFIGCEGTARQQLRQIRYFCMTLKTKREKALNFALYGGIRTPTLTKRNVYYNNVLGHFVPNEQIYAMDPDPLEFLAARSARRGVKRPAASSEVIDLT